MTEQVLTEDDLDTLVAALEAWEAKDFGIELLDGMLGSMFEDKLDQSAMARRKEQQRQAQEKRARESATRKERSVLLRARLLTIRNDRRTERVEQAAARDAVGQRS